MLKRLNAATLKTKEQRHPKNVMVGARCFRSEKSSLIPSFHVAAQEAACCRRCLQPLPIHNMPRSDWVLTTPLLGTADLKINVHVGTRAKALDTSWFRPGPTLFTAESGDLL